MVLAKPYMEATSAADTPLSAYKNELSNLYVCVCVCVCRWACLPCITWLRVDVT